MKRMLWVLPVVMLCGMAMGDSIDDAEAKKRGVPVSQIEVERQLAAAQKKNEDLAAQAAELKSKPMESATQLSAARKSANEEYMRAMTAEAALRATKTILTPEQKKTLADKEAQIAKVLAAISNGIIISGMTLDEAKSAIRASSSTQTAGLEGAGIWLLKGETGSYSVTIQNNAVTEWERIAGNAAPVIGPRPPANVQPIRGEPQIVR